MLGWSFSPKGYAGTAESPIPPELETPLQEGGEVLRPDIAVRERDRRDDGSRWQLLVKVIEPGDDFDRVAGGAGRLEVSAHGRMERLLRPTGVPAGLLSNGRTLRLVSAPRGESSGWLESLKAQPTRLVGLSRSLARPARGRHSHHVGPAHRGGAAGLLLSETRLLALPRDKRCKCRISAHWDILITSASRQPRTDPERCDGVPSQETGRRVIDMEIRCALELRADDSMRSPGRLFGTLLTYGERAAGGRSEVFEPGALEWPEPEEPARNARRRSACGGSGRSPMPTWRCPMRSSWTAGPT